MNLRWVIRNYRPMTLQYAQLRSFVCSNSVEIVAVWNVTQPLIDAAFIQDGESAVKTKAEVLARFQAHLAEERYHLSWNVKQLKFTHIQLDFLVTIFGYGFTPSRASLNASMPLPTAALPYSNAKPSVRKKGTMH